MLRYFLPFPDTNCKPNFSSVINGGSPSDPGQKPTFDAESIVGLIIWFCCVLYSSIRTASNGQTERLIGSDKVLAKDETGSSGKHWRFNNSIKSTSNKILKITLHI